MRPASRAPSQLGELQGPKQAQQIRQRTEGWATAEVQDRPMGLRLPPCADGDHRPGGDAPPLQDAAVPLEELTRRPPAVPSQVARSEHQQAGRDDGLGLVAAVRLLFVSETRPRSVTLQIFTKSLEGPTGVIPRGPSGLRGAPKLPLTTSLSLSAPSGHKCRGLGKSFKSPPSNGRRLAFLKAPPFRRQGSLS